MFDFILLYEDSQKQFTEQYPQCLSAPDAEIVQRLCIPPTVIEKKNEIFSINTDIAYYYIWSFCYRESPCAIVIASSRFRPALFFDFFRAVKKSFDGDASDPLCRFGFVKSLLMSWYSNDEGDLVINYPLDSFTLRITGTESWTSNFKISPLYPEIDQIWRSIILNRSVLIVAPSAEIASGSIIAIFHLFEPLFYEEPILLYTNENDPRYEELLTANCKYKIVGTTDKSLIEKQKGFATVVEIQQKDFQDMSELKQIYKKKTRRLILMIMNGISYHMLSDPYFNILNKKINTDNFCKVFREYPKEFFEEFQKTLTFQKWRHRKFNIEHIRTAFLSVTPEDATSRIKDDELNQAYNELKRIIHFCQRDTHLRTVLERNLRILKRKMNSVSKRQCI